MDKEHKHKNKLCALLGVLGSLGISGTAVAAFLMNAGENAKQCREDHKRLDAVECKANANELNLRESMTEQRVMFKVIKDELHYIREKVDQ